jgi:hypothetical protein
MAAVISRRNLQIWAVGTPFLLIGTYEQMAAQLLEQAGESGISSYVVREAAIPHLEHVLALLAN